MSISVSLGGKVALVTGAAGEKGIGRSIALTLAKAGADVAVNDEVVDIYDRNLGAVAEEIRSLGRKSLAVQADVAIKSEVAEMVLKVEDALGPVDILVNNAAILGPQSNKPFDFTEEEWDRTMDVDLKSHYLCTEAVAEGMMERKTGSIVHIDSIEGYTFQVGGLRPYAVAKAGVRYLTRMNARQLGPYNIRVNTICTGAVETDMGLHNRWYDGYKERPGILDKPDRRMFEGAKWIPERIPLNRAGEPEEIANVALFLASDLSSYVTGATILADGGWVA